MKDSLDPANFDNLCDDFEQAWAKDAQPVIEDYLDRVSESLRGECLVELLQVDLWRRRSESLPPTIESYRERFPNLISAVDKAFRRFEQREQDGLSVTSDFGAAVEIAQEDTLTQPDTDTPVGKSGSFSVSSGTETDIPKTIGRYTIVGRLGRGGQGAVYRAVHPNLPIELAIKVGCKQISEATRQAMLDEARVLCDLDHPNIAKIRDLEFDEDGLPVLVLDLIRGRSLQQLLREGGIPTERAVGWLASAADAVGFAHRRGVLHLDLKPGNIVIDEHDQAKVIDFGLARSRDVWSDAESELDGISGTPDYMAPEQATGISEKITARADIFALGAILYRILTGDSPFHASTPQQAVLRSRRYDLDLDRLDNADAPSHLSAACRRAIARDPSQRFASAEEFKQAIESKSEIGESAVATSTDSKSTSFSFGLFGVTLKFAITMSVLLIGTFAVYKFTRTDKTKVSMNEPTDSLGGIGVGVRDRRVDSPAPMIESAQALEGDIHLSVVRDGKLIPIEAPNARPIKPGDGIRVEASLNRPAYLYLVWIDESGQAQPFHPGVPGDWTQLTTADKPVDFVVLPEAGGGYPMEGQSGMQTILLLARQTPLPESQDLGELFTGLPYQTLQDPRALVYLDEGDVSERNDRSPNFFKTIKTDDPVLETQQLLRKRLRNHFPLIRTVSVAFQSDKTE